MTLMTLKYSEVDEIEEIVTYLPGIKGHGKVWGCLPKKLTSQNFGV